MQKELEQEQARLVELEQRDGTTRRSESRRSATLSERIEARYAEETKKSADTGQPLQPSAELAALQAELAAKTSELRKLQGESPLMQV